MLYVIDATVSDNSRTRMLGEYLLKNYKEEYKVIKLEDLKLKPLDNKRLKDREDYYLENIKGTGIIKYAKDLKKASKIVILAPCYDLSFPSLLKLYIENILISDYSFEYLDNGDIKSNLKIKSLTYITTSGGYIFNDSYGFLYIKDIFKTFFKVRKFNYIKAEGLDIVNNDVDSIIEDAKKEIDKIEL